MVSSFSFTKYVTLHFFLYISKSFIYSIHLIFSSTFEGKMSLQTSQDQSLLGLLTTLHPIFWSHTPITHFLILPLHCPCFFLKLRWIFFLLINKFHPYKYIQAILSLSLSLHPSFPPLLQNL